MYLLYLLPPSEGKMSGGQAVVEQLTFSFHKPLDIATHATEKDLKCSGKRYEEGIQLNQDILSSPTLPALERYTGVMFKAVGYDTLTTQDQKYFNQHVLICSGMYGILSPQDRIGNYKLPIASKGLYQFWKNQDLTASLITYAREHDATLIDLLPGSYKKMIDRKDLDASDIPYIQIHFYQKHENERKKYTHGVKKVKGAWLRHHIIEKTTHIKDLGGVQTGQEIQIRI